jgi:hypothetical protein
MDDGDERDELMNRVDAIFEAVHHLMESPRTRELRGKAESYRRELESWPSAGPTGAQREAMEDLVLALEKKVRDAIRYDPLAHPMKRASGGRG